LVVATNKNANFFGQHPSAIELSSHSATAVVLSIRIGEALDDGVDAVENRVARRRFSLFAAELGEVERIGI
jgi:hypothetical protein